MTVPGEFVACFAHRLNVWHEFLIPRPGEWVGENQSETTKSQCGVVGQERVGTAVWYSQ